MHIISTNVSVLTFLFFSLSSQIYLPLYVMLSESMVSTSVFLAYLSLNSLIISLEAILSPSVGLRARDLSIISLITVVSELDIKSVK